jgi:hypothetical protein
MMANPACLWVYASWFCRLIIVTIFVYHGVCGSLVSRYSVGSIATHSTLYSPGIESQWMQDFLQPSGPATGPTQTPVQWVQGLFPMGKVAGIWY